MKNTVIIYSIVAIIVIVIVYYFIKNRQLSKQCPNVAVIQAYCGNPSHGSCQGFDSLGNLYYGSTPQGYHMAPNQPKYNCALWENNNNEQIQFCSLTS